MSNTSDVNEKQNDGLPMIRSSEWARTASCIAYAVSKIRSAYLRYPSRPSDTSDAHVAAKRPLEREPSIPGDAYLPPDQSVMKKYWPLRSALSRNIRIEVPLTL